MTKNQTRKRGKTQESCIFYTRTRSYIIL